MSHNTNKRIAQNTLFLYFRTLVILLVSLYTSRVVLNVLGIDDYGIYNVVGGIVLMFQFLNVGMIDVSQRFLTYELGKNDGQQLQKFFHISYHSPDYYFFPTYISRNSRSMVSQS